jgi:hypothetical protein
MESINFRASMHNLTQADRHQEEVHRTPVVNQQRSEDMGADAALRRLGMPVEPEETDTKTVDPGHRGKVFMKRRRREKKEREKEDRRRRNRGEGSGRFVDIDA